MDLKIVSIGGTRIDWIVSAAGKLVPNVPGGNAWYAAVGAHVWCPDVGVVTRVREQVSQGWLAELAWAGIDQRGARPSAGRRGIVGLMRYASNGTRSGDAAQYFGERGLPLPGALAENTVRDAEEAEAIHVAVSPIPAEVPEAYWEADIFLILAMPYVSQRAFVERLRGRGKLILLDPASTYMDPACGQDLGLLFEGVDVLLPSEIELRTMYGSLNVEQAIPLLSAYGPPIVALKVGAAGSIVYDRAADRMYHVPAYPCAARDPTGAGDSYVGGFGAGYWATGDAVQAALHATVSASFTVEDFGMSHVLRRTREEAVARLAHCEVSMMAQQGSSTQRRT